MEKMGIPYQASPITKLHHWTHLIIDECAQATEPETLIPISVVAYDPEPVHIVLCGDHQQLGPTVLSKEAQKQGLYKSLLERLMDLGYASMASNFHSVHLKRNYRSHPSIIMMPSLLFYHDKLIPAAEPSKTQMYHFQSSQSDLNVPVQDISIKGLKWPVVFYGVKGTDFHDINQIASLSSWYLLS